jgi:hypothetical protein
MYAKQWRECGTWAKLEGSSLALTTTPGAVPVVKGASAVKVYCASAWQMKLSPRVKAVFVSADTGVTFTDYTDAARDGDASTVVDLSSFPVTTGYLYVLFDSRESFANYNGLAIDVVAANGTSSVLTCTYYKGTWAALSLTDGTISSGKTMAVDGSITWTAVTDAKPTTINGVTGWAIRFVVDASLDSSTTVASIVPLTVGTGAYFAANDDPLFALEPAVGGIEATASSGTLYFAWITADRL